MHKCTNYELSKEREKLLHKTLMIFPTVFYCFLQTRPMSVKQTLGAEQTTDSWFTRMVQQLSGVTVVIIVAGGVLTFLLLFIFAKRQIMRFTLRSHRAPHAPFGQDAKKVSCTRILYNFLLRMVMLCYSAIAATYLKFSVFCTTKSVYRYRSRPRRRQVLII